MGTEKDDMEEIKRMFAQINTKLTAVQEKLDKNEETISELKHENQRLIKTIKVQEERLEQVEREIRRNNIIIQGLPDIDGENQEGVKEEIQGVLREIGVEINPLVDIKETTKLGIYKPNKKRPILVKLQTWDKKMEIFKRTKELKGKDIWINDDYTKKVQDDRKILIPHLKQAKQQGHRAYLRHNKLIVNGEAFGVEDFQNPENKEKGKEEENQREGKRTASERSPEGEAFNQQQRKITKITSKN